MDAIERSRLWEIFVDGLPDFAMILLDADGKILSWNTGAAKMLGYATDGIIGRNFSCLYTDEDKAAGKPAVSLKDAVAYGQHRENGRRVRQNGTQLEAQGTLIPLYDAQKSLLGFGSLTRDALTRDALTRDAMNLPRAAVALAQSAPSNVVSLAGPKKILMVDDNAEILEALGLQLTSLGYQVIAAANGAEALEILARVADIDLLFTDVVMPGGMNGSQLATEARSLRPGLKVLFTSGYFQGALVQNRTIDANVRVLAKPYRKQELAKRVGEALSG
ncbi:MAG: response regulator [Reyranella sp.]|nr:response regulator [Reyranella sp.]